MKSCRAYRALAEAAHGVQISKLRRRLEQANKALLAALCQRDAAAAAREWRAHATRSDIALAELERDYFLEESIHCRPAGRARRRR
ncbi:hypothetical protein [Thiocapsa roseopersicina]|uniref:hypothetical protein n=1 Tax=Thiocapsa roseopersicina TaxID=1058 RepID=UPI000B8181E4|nr:hypothetical protein [Thiocapsa roseopersicina]